MPPGQQAAYLNECCADDARVRAEVEALIAEDDQLKRPTLTAGNTSSEDMCERLPRAIPQQIGPYRIIREVGHGGMGAVYEAEQDVPRRRVALKIIRPEKMSRSLQRRFHHESSVLARLRHSGIAQVYDAGIHHEGHSSTPFFVMEFIPNAETLTEFAQRRNLGLRKKLELFIRVCEAVHHGHQKGVIHRDIKPDNILVDTEADTPQPKIIDFGVARATDSDVTLATMHTHVGQIVGTLQYMSPEQVTAEPEEIDTRSDVYALGVVLFELLTGRLPYDVRQAPIHQASMMIRELAPSRLSSADHNLRGDIETIVSKALEKDKERRYASASALVADVRRYLNNQPITARPPSAMYQIRVFARRNKAVFTAIVAVVVVSITAAIISARFGLVARARQAVAEQQAYRAQIIAATTALENHQISAARQYLESTPAHLRGWEHDHLHSRLQQDAVTLAFDTTLQVFALSPDGRDVAVGLEDGNLRIVDASSGQTTQTLRDTWAGVKRYHSIRFIGADSLFVMIASKEGDTFVYVATVWDITSGTVKASYVLPDSGGSFAVSADGQRAFITHDDSGTAQRTLFDTTTGSAVISRAFGTTSIASVFSPDGALIASADLSGAVFILDSTTLEVVDALPHHDTVHGLAFNPRATMLASASTTGTLHAWDLTERPGIERSALRGHLGDVRTLMFSPDGMLLASGGADRTVRLWDMVTAQSTAVFAGHHHQILGLAFSSDRRLYSYDVDSIRMRDVRSADPMVLRGHHSFVNPVAFSQDGALILSGGWDGFVGQPGALRIWDADSGEPVCASGPGYYKSTVLARAPQGTLIAAAFERMTGTPQTVLLDTSCLHLPRTIDFDQDALMVNKPWPPDSIAFDPAGSRLIVASQSGYVAIWDVLNNRELLRRSMWDAHTDVNPFDTLCRVSWSPDGRWIAVTSANHSVQLWDAESGNVIHQWAAHDRGICSIAFSPDSRHIVTASQDESVRVWSSATGERIATLLGHGHDILCAAYSPDGARISSGGRDAKIRLWDTTTYDEVVALGGHSAYVYALAWSPDGQCLISGSGDGTVRIWDTRPAAERLAAQREYERIVTQVDPLVDALVETMELEHVAQALLDKATLTEHERQVAMQRLLRTILNRWTPSELPD